MGPSQKFWNHVSCEASCASVLDKLRSHMRNELAYDHIFFSSLIPPRGSLHERLAELAAVRVLSPGCNGLVAKFGATNQVVQ